ncbi:DUF58 domain-containing protein [candidate division LCP-89 bacterium B3_LCP]|uniref:DUF58 domain-containing protein n=1 Tax=candidate division LCP-89 bacterium B3_LCP TaxID=2012998 RepID=A0A532V584_UNCL8|nr:MAG: DUF58 domain-containing protein [candidate division LCP-89 bacterium B3_LCP]
METREVLKKVRQVEIKTRGIVEEIFSGEYHSVFKGRGIEFAEVREYMPGDDIRSVDWNVTARMGHPYIKLFEEERELTVMLLCDFSSSGYFGSVKQLKIEVAIEVAALLAFSALKNQDKVGLLLFTDSIEKYVPPKKGKTHVLRILRELISFQPERAGTDIRQALEYFQRVQSKRSIAFLISDFWDEGFEDDLRLVGKKHDLIALSLRDPREETIPPVGLLKLQDAETGEELWLDTYDRKVSSGIETIIKDKKRELNKLLRSSDIDHVELPVNQDYILPLSRFFRLRAKRR